MTVENIRPVYIGLGTNKGDRLQNLCSARAALPPQVTILAQSSVYETEPWGYEDQECFLNQVVRAETRLAPQGLLTYLKEIEEKLGRKPTFRMGPRLIDLDILFYGDLVLDTEHLTIPHPRIPERAFVLVPLAEIAPHFVHPGLEKPISALVEKVDSEGVVLFQKRPEQG